MNVDSDMLKYALPIPYKIIAVIGNSVVLSQSSENDILADWDLKY